jgi:hypothetical protein
MCPSSKVMMVVKFLESGLLIYTELATKVWRRYMCGPKGLI